MNIDYEKLVLLEELLFKAEAAAGIYSQPQNLQEKIFSDKDIQRR